MKDGVVECLAQHSSGQVGNLDLDVCHGRQDLSLAGQRQPLFRSLDDRVSCWSVTDGAKPCGGVEAATISAAVNVPGYCVAVPSLSVAVMT